MEQAVHRSDVRVGLDDKPAVERSAPAGELSLGARADERAGTTSMLSLRNAAAALHLAIGLAATTP